MAIEQDRSGLGKYSRLSDNPLYYKNALQYCGGSIYRAALGYETLWDRAKENQLRLCLDYLLVRHSNLKEYYLTTATATRDALLYGIRWHRGLAPRKLKFDLQWPFNVKSGELLTVRVNLLDKPFHVDIEQSDGAVHTILYTRYRSLIDNGLFKPIGEPSNDRATKSQRPEQTTDVFKGRKSQGYQMVRRLIKENPIRQLSSKLLHMR